MKIAVSSWSFHQYVNQGKLDYISIIEKAKELGFDAIEYIDLITPECVSEYDYAVQIRKECEKNDIIVSNYTIFADLLNAPDNAKDEIERLKRKIDIAEVLGSKNLRHDVATGFKEGNPRNQRGFRDVVDYMAESCRKVTEYAEEKGIRTMVENHGVFSQDAERVELLINKVGHKNFGWLCDMGNFLCADENPAISVGKAAPYVFYAHAKDFIVKDGNGCNPGEGFFKSRAANYLRGTIIGHGDVPVKQCLSILKNAGYDGYLGIEFEGMEDCIKGIKIGYDNLKRYLEEI